MKHYKISKRDTSKIHVHVLVNPEENEIAEGRTFESPKLDPLPKPSMPRRFVSKITPPLDGRVEFVFRGR